MMKKIILGMILPTILCANYIGSLIYSDDIYNDPCINGTTQECCCNYPHSSSCGERSYDCGSNGNSANNGSSTNNVGNGLSDMGINLTTDCLTNGQCSMNIYKALGIRKSNENPSVTVFAQDVVLASTTFIGTVITVILIVCGIFYAINSISGKSIDKAKKGIVNCLVGLLAVMGSYTLIRLIQFIATGGS